MQLKFVPRILVVEDNPLDVRLISKSFEGSPLQDGLNVVHDGAEAIDYLNSCNSDKNVPHLVLLDLNLPKKSGFEVLAEMRSNDRLKLIPVIVLSGSSSGAEILQAYKLQANLYILKPLDFKEFIKIAEFIVNFCRIGSLPQSI